MFPSWWWSPNHRSATVGNWLCAPRKWIRSSISLFRGCIQRRPGGFEFYKDLCAELTLPKERLSNSQRALVTCRAIIWGTARKICIQPGRISSHSLWEDSTYKKDRSKYFRQGDEYDDVGENNETINIYDWLLNRIAPWESFDLSHPLLAEVAQIPKFLSNPEWAQSDDIASSHPEPRNGD